MFEVSKFFSFESAHSLPYLPEGHKCRRVHGHSYRFEVVCSGELDERGFVIDYSEITEAVLPLLNFLDHQNLNEILPFYSTAENLCRWIYEQLKNKIPVHVVHLYETAATKVTYPV